MIRVAFLLLAILAITVPAPCFAGPILSLTSIDDLGNLTVGEAVTIDVELSGLNPGDELDFLFAAIQMPAGIFGNITTPVAGPIVPPGGFFSAFNSPDALYLNLSLLPADNIVTNGVFFSFTADVIGTGSAVIDFDPGIPPSYAGTIDGNLIIIGDADVGDPLAVMASGGGPGTVPEPGGVAVWSLLMGLAFLKRRRLSPA